MPSVLITGTSKGIGRATATEFAARGRHVVATARDPRALAGLDVAQRLRLDVTDQTTVDDAVAAAGEVDVPVAAAGVIFLGAVETSPVAEIERLFARNTAGSIRVAQTLLPQMRERRSGHLLFVSSVVGRIVFSGNAASTASKWALESLAESLAIETGRFGIHATLLEPGSVSSGALDAPLVHRLPDDPYTALAADSLDRGAAITPEQVATAVADAAEPDAPPLRLPIGEAADTILAARRRRPTASPSFPDPDRTAAGAGRRPERGRAGAGRVAQDLPSSGVTWRSPHCRRDPRTGAISSPAGVSRYSSRGGCREYWRRSTSPAASSLRSRGARVSRGAPVLVRMSLNRLTPKPSLRSTSRIHRSPTTSSASAMEQTRGAPGFVGSLSRLTWPP
ncbi:SDR family NAD(P)-dependent oxidoreductase [Streptomyces sp. ITFR-21]|nr:SDR family NAD(P)-dependent oxidoreductase [Streptomyces sp. ITFR-21]WNI18823.1 SDR family NAD(P)-dependent oxidoreductase [Streptomyces sp. ITFR-21]